ncbi:hypothetical protein V6N13_108613 [Hibiscus sabdariffa]
MATGDLIPGNKCGRQPENVISLEDCSILERPGSPVVAELQPASTKGRNFEEQMEERVLSFKDTLIGGIDRKQEELLVEDLDVEYGHAKEVCVMQGNQVAEGESHPIHRDLNELYGPWMQVVNKRRRNMINVGTPSGSNGVSNGRSVGGSRHAVLTNEEEIDAGGDVGESREAQTNNNLGASSLRHMREEGSLALAKYGMVNTESRRKPAARMYDTTET